MIPRTLHNIRVCVTGRPSYERWTLVQWLYEVKDILEDEYRVSIEIEVVDTDDPIPLLLIEGYPVLEGIPGEEGYLIEILKKALDRLLYYEEERIE